jgi:lipid-A-disaccharide synthase
MKYYLIAGEASGDLHGSHLIRELLTLDKAARFRCWGGPLMQDEGADLVKNYQDLAFMGFLEVLENLPAILRNFRFAKADIANFQPDVLILIDYPGFNLRMAKWAKKRDFHVVYYISPQVWAWKESRVRQIQRFVDKMLVILPFEQAFYQKWNLPVEYVGHPLLQVVDDYRLRSAESTKSRLLPNADFIPEKKLVALLPGSRKQEISRKLPIMLEMSIDFPNCQFMVAKAPGQGNQIYQSLLEKYPSVTLTDQAYALLMSADAACVTSGTATLETALFGVPEVVCYKGSWISYQIARRLIKVKYICLVNLILDKPAITELIQGDFTRDNLRNELRDLLENSQRKLEFSADYTYLRKLLGEKGRASANAARIIVEYLTSNVALPERTEPQR